MAEVVSYSSGEYQDVVIPRNAARVIVAEDMLAPKLTLAPKSFSVGARRYFSGDYSRDIVAEERRYFSGDYSRDIVAEERRYFSTD